MYRQTAAAREHPHEQNTGEDQAFHLQLLHGLIVSFPLAESTALIGSGYFRGFLERSPRSSHMCLRPSAGRDYRDFSFCFLRELREARKAPAVSAALGAGTCVVRN